MSVAPTAEFVEFVDTGLGFVRLYLVVLRLFEALQQEQMWLVSLCLRSMMIKLHKTRARIGLRRNVTAVDATEL